MMEKLFNGVMNVIASQVRIGILEEIMKGVDHPDDLAKKFNMTRQAIDKHLMFMYSLGLIDRAALYPPDGRPRIVYTVSREGVELVRDIQIRVRRYAEDRWNRYLHEISQLDAKLASGELSEDAHKRLVNRLKKRYRIIET